MSQSNNGRVIGIEFDEKSAKKRSIVYTKENFRMYSTWFNEYFTIHNIVFESIGDNLDNFYKVFDTKFFDWLNKPKNNSKFMFEIKKEFMVIADEVILFEIMIERFKKSENRFVIPVLKESSESESDHDIYDIDYFSDHDPCYNLMEERQIPEEYTSDIESTNYDDQYYLSFFT